MSSDLIDRPQAKTDLIPILNPPQAAALTADMPKLRAILRMHGIPVWREDTAQAVRKYQVFLFQHQILKIYKVEEQTVWLNNTLDAPTETVYEDVTEELDEAEARRIHHYAVRSLYAMGLDFGSVSIGAASPTRMRVLDVHPDPVLPQESGIDFAGMVGDFVAEFQAARRTVRNVMLGADPEFALRRPDGTMGIASDFLGKMGVIGCDAARLREEGRFSQQRPLVEVRPQPTTDPHELFLHIAKALRFASRKITDDTLEWVAGGMPFDGYPIGGHIHLSGIPLTFQLIRKLDAYLCLPLALIEDEGCQARRPRYGFLGDFRTQDHGGFEYRTLPSWLVSPRITKAVLALTKIIATHHELLTIDTLPLNIQKAYYDSDRSILLPFARRVYREINRLPLFASYKKDLQPFFSTLFSGEIWLAKSDIRQAWRVPPFHLNNTEKTML
ncbi:putative amidoligase domain-containing protein [Brevibacillus dissolubilis]|uniref:putative amidoligase domain-containing protein n=1 Tax=Brevibacillus dissolubilis TaxID=1844116 RepID=UPI0011177B70|nr:hypothetical protein [Brevibacillus dissolubilis]